MSRLSIYRGDDLLAEHVLMRAVVGLGRHPENDIVLDDRTLSRFHARVERRGDRYVVIDLGAQNGVHLNGQRIVGESDLEPGDRIGLGRYVAIFDAQNAGPSRQRVEKQRSGAKDLKNEHSVESGDDYVDVGKTGDLERDVDEVSADRTANVVAEDIDIDLDELNDSSEERPVEPVARKAKGNGSNGSNVGAQRKGPASEDKDPFEDSATSVESKPPQPTLVLLYNGLEVSRHPIGDAELVIGRSKGCDVVISLLGLSRRHARVVPGDEGVGVEDMGSQNGTWVNNQRIEGLRRLRHGDLLNFYDYGLLFLEDGEVEVGFPGAGFAVKGSAPDADDDLSQRETSQGKAPLPQSSPAKAARSTQRSPVPIVDSASKDPASKDSRDAGSKDRGSKSPGTYNPPAAGAGVKGAKANGAALPGLSVKAPAPAEISELQKDGGHSEIDLGEGSFLGDEFDDEKNRKATDFMSQEADDDPVAPGDGTALIDNPRIPGLDDSSSVGLGGSPGASQEADEFENGATGADAFEGDKTKASLERSELRPGKREAWPTEAELKDALSNATDGVLVTLEVFLDGKMYTQMPLSQTVTRVGTDARCEFAVPKASGLRAWHITLVHLGARVACYRASQQAQITVGGVIVDKAILQDGDELLLGRVKIMFKVL